MEYSSTPYVGMASPKNGVSNNRVQNDMFITLLHVLSSVNMNPTSHSRALPSLTGLLELLKNISNQQVAKMAESPVLLFFFYGQASTILAKRSQSFCWVLQISISLHTLLRLLPKKCPKQVTEKPLYKKVQKPSM